MEDKVTRVDGKTEKLPMLPIRSQTNHVTAVATMDKIAS